jgi:hypothetical protein
VTHVGKLVLDDVVEVVLVPVVVVPVVLTELV